MVNRIEIERLLQSKELKELWQTIQQELPQLYFCKDAVRRTQILNDQTQLIQISNDFFRASHIRFGHDLDQRHAASVIIH